MPSNKITLTTEQLEDLSFLIQATLRSVNETTVGAEIALDDEGRFQIRVLRREDSTMGTETKSYVVAEPA